MTDNREQITENRIGLLPSFLTKENLKFLLFGGKGGVGKTTSATSTAIYLARTRPQKKFLVFSTDPAHSLSDSFAQPIKDEPTVIKGFSNLFSMEMSFQKVYEAFVREYEFELIELAERSSYFGIKHMSNASATLSYPTSFEFMVMMKLIELSKSKEYDLIVVDTAPTGHTLVLLELLSGITDQFKALERSQAKHRYMMTRYYGQYRKDRADKFLDMMKDEVETLRKIFTGNRTEFVVVTIAEEMAIWESRRLLQALRKREYQIPNRNIIVNGLSQSTLCSLCASRKKEEESYLNEIAQEFPTHNVIKMPLFPYEIRGEKLREYADFLQGKSPFEIEKVALSLRNPGKDSPEIDRLSGVKIDGLLEKENRCFLLFGGKGGVGKTTSAAATAVHIAKTNPDRKILAFSTDPAHSLADSFDLPITDKITLIEGFTNLCGLQIDPEKRFEQFKVQYRKKVKEAFAAKAESGGGMAGLTGTRSGVSHPFDEETILNLVTMAPLGLDEIMALSRVALNDSHSYDVIIIDTAPTGHLVKLLQRPEMVLRWFTKIIEGLKTYSGMMDSTFEVTKELLEARREIAKTHRVFMDEKQAEFVVVTIAEFMGMYETERLVKDLEGLKIASRFIIANKIIPKTECPFCGSKRGEQSRYIDQIRKKFPSFEVVETPLFPHEIRGVKSLIDFANCLYEKQGTEDIVSPDVTLRTGREAMWQQCRLMRSRQRIENRRQGREDSKICLLTSEGWNKAI